MSADEPIRIVATLDLDTRIIATLDLDDPSRTSESWWLAAYILDPEGNGYGGFSGLLGPRGVPMTSGFGELPRDWPTLTIRLALARGPEADRELMDISSQPGGGGLDLGGWSDGDILYGISPSPAPARGPIPRGAYFEATVGLMSGTLSGDSFTKNGPLFFVSGESDGSAEIDENDALLILKLTVGAT